MPDYTYRITFLGSLVKTKDPHNFTGVVVRLSACKSHTFKLINPIYFKLIEEGHSEDFNGVS